MNPRPSAPIAVAAVLALTLAPGCANTQSTNRADSPALKATAQPTPDNTELQALCDADQADRQDLHAIDWHEVSERDQAREARVRAMLAAGSVRTGPDYFNAALVCQHSSELDGIQLAHELSMISAALGERRARWLMAASYDRLLNRLNQPQRFATQYFQKGTEPMHLTEIRPGVTDSMRQAINVPTLEQAQAQEAELNRTPTPH